MPGAGRLGQTSDFRDGAWKEGQKKAVEPLGNGAPP